MQFAEFSYGYTKCYALIRPVWWYFFFTRGQFWPSGIVVTCVCFCVCVCPSMRQSQACPRDNSSPVWARTKKIRPEVQNTLVKILIVLGIDWAWHVKFNLFSKSCLFASLLRLWNICETWKTWKRSLFHILNGWAQICSPTASCHGPWNSRVVSLVWPLLASQSLNRRLAMDFLMLL